MADRREKVKKAQESSRTLCDIEDNFKASRRIGDTTSAWHWVKEFRKEVKKP
jgi:hypothetical protein